MSEYKDENMLIKVCSKEKKKLIDYNIRYEKKLSRSFGIIIIYLIYVRSGYSIIITMHT